MSGHELGSWMIPGDEKEYSAGYLTSLAAVTSPEEFAAAALPLVRRDSWQNFYAQTYASAVRVASEEQQASLDAEIQRHKVRMPEGARYAPDSL